MGTVNPCGVCGKELKKGKKFVYLSCKEMGYGHGNDCVCYFPVGAACAKKRGLKIPPGKRW